MGHGWARLVADALHGVTSAPVQPAKMLFVAGRAVSDTRVPTSNVAAHVGGQMIPAGVLSTTPWPGPPVVTSSKRPSRKAAITLVRSRTGTVQVAGGGPLVGVHSAGTAPCQPAKNEPRSG